LNGWASFWTFVIIITVAAFALLAIVVTIGGFRDLKILLRKEEKTDDSES
tara:strand:- start:390 stop:539 length:150 start_codon:yes stop_codon:yes gene_type:complete